MDAVTLYSLDNCYPVDIAVLVFLILIVLIIATRYSWWWTNSSGKQGCFTCIQSDRNDRKDFYWAACGVPLWHELSYLQKDKIADGSSRRHCLSNHPYETFHLTFDKRGGSFYRDVWFSTDLKWNRHIDEITAKANRTLGFLKRNFGVNSSTLKAKAYIALVRPQVEYCSCVLDPRLGVENNSSCKIEWIQRRVGRWCLLHDNNTSSITLVQRRMDSRLTALFKIIRGFLSVNSLGLLRPVISSPTRHSHLKSFNPASN